MVFVLFCILGFQCSENDTLNLREAASQLLLVCSGGVCLSSEASCVLIFMFIQLRNDGVVEVQDDLFLRT